MRTAIWESAENTSYISGLRQKIREKCPVVQCITNIVTVNDCANALLAIGASATMAHHPEEMADFALLCDALVCNMGATESLEAMQRAMVHAKERSHPIVVDPVGCAGSPYRRGRCLALLRETPPSCIRGNAAEIKALALDCNTGRGVDDLSGRERSTPEYVAHLAAQTGAIVIASGKIDYIGNGERVLELHGGSTMMARITGSGCMLSSLMGAFLAADPSLESAAACCSVMNACGEQAQRWAEEAGRGTGTFHIGLIDALSMD